MTGVFGSGCATVSVVGMTGEAAEQAEASAATPAQQRLRASSAEFAAHASEAGWADTETVGGAARRAFTVLLHGRDAADASDETRQAVLSPAEAFVRDRAYDVADPVDVTASLAAEIREARVGVRAVNAAAAEVVQGPERPAWSRREDVRAAETVVQLARRARTMFRDVSGVVDDRLEADQVAMVRGELDAFDVELDRLSAAADALSMAHPKVELGRVPPIASGDDTSGSDIG